MVHSATIVEIAKGRISNNESGSDCDFSVVHGRCFQRALKCNIEWGTYFGKLIESAINPDSSNSEIEKMVTDYLLQDVHWNWLAKAAEKNGDEFEWFFFDAEEVPQGACVIYHPKASALQEGNVFYIEYIASAPWNRNIPGQTKRFSGVGKVLIQNALRFAMSELGLKPGFNLHSLPQSNKYYENLGMQRIDGMEKDGMNFFEMPSHLALEF
jgi:hypothetical protein